MTSGPHPPWSDPIPAWLHSVQHERPFTECSACSTALGPDVDYMILKSFRRDECVCELVVCRACSEKQAARWSAESTRAISEFKLRWLEHLEHEDGEACDYCGKPVSWTTGVTVHARCQGDGVWWTDHMCEPCENELHELLSSETREEHDRFMRTLLPGPPSMEQPIPEEAPTEAASASQPIASTSPTRCAFIASPHGGVPPLEQAQESFVLVALDFPNGEEAQSAVPNPDRNGELQAKVGIQGCPTCLLMNTDGAVFARMGYQEGGHEKHVDDMHSNTVAGKALLVELSELAADYAAAADKTPVITRAIGVLADMDSESVGVTLVADLAGKALRLDPENRAGLKLQAIQALLGSGQANDEVITAARQLDTDNALGLLEQVVEAQFQGVSSEATARAAIDAIEKLLDLDTVHDPATVKRMAAMGALWCEGPLDDHEHAVKLAERSNALEADLDESLVDRLAEILEKAPRRIPG